MSHSEPVPTIWQHAGGASFSFESFQYWQSAIIETPGLQPDFNAAHSIDKRVAFLMTYLVDSRQASYVVGISGGVDSLTAGLLAQRAVL